MITRAQTRVVVGSEKSNKIFGEAMIFCREDDPCRRFSLALFTVSIEW